LVVHIKAAITGIHGAAIDTTFTDGLSVIHWLREPFTTGVYKTLNDVIAVHGHEGGTQLHFIDENETAQIPQGGSQ